MSGKRGGAGATKPCDVYKCMTCEGMPEFEKPAFLEHLKAAHNIEIGVTPFERRMLCHIDADRWYEYQYQWEEKKEGGVKFQQLVRNLRDKDSPMYR